MARTACLCVLLLVPVCFGCAPARENNRLTKQEKQLGFTLLFDGKSMDQWRNYRAEGIKPHRQVIDGAMVLTEKAGRGLQVLGDGRRIDGSKMPGYLMARLQQQYPSGLGVH